MPTSNATPRSSQINPLQLATIEPPDVGRIGLTYCSGQEDPQAMTGAWDRDLVADLEVIRKRGVSTLFTLVEQHELDLPRVPNPGEAARAPGAHLDALDDSGRVRPHAGVRTTLWPEAARLRTSSVNSGKGATW